MDAEDLKSAGLKVTLPRLKILEVFIIKYYLPLMKQTLMKMVGHL